MSSLKDKMKEAVQQGTKERDDALRDKEWSLRAGNQKVADEIISRIPELIRNAVVAGKSEVEIMFISVVKVHPAFRGSEPTSYLHLVHDSAEQLVCKAVEETGAELKFVGYQGDRVASGTESYSIRIINLADF